MGEITADSDRYQVRFERVIRKPIDKVFAALTTPEVLEAWIGAAEIEPEPGGRFILTFRDPTYRMDGQVIAYVPPTLFEFTWPNAADDTTSHVRFTLTSDGPTTRLVLTQTFIAKTDLPNVAAGWHEHLERLEPIMDGLADTRWNKRREAELASVYREVVAAAG